MRRIMRSFVNVVELAGSLDRYNGGCFGFHAFILSHRLTAAPLYSSIKTSQSYKCQEGYASELESVYLIACQRWTSR